MKIKHSLRKLALVLDSPKIQTRIIVFELLAAIAMLSSEGHKLVVDAMSYFKMMKREKSRFFTIVESLRQADNVDYQVDLSF